MSAAVASDVANWIVAILPVILLLAAFDWLDVLHLLGWRELAAMLLMGVVAGLAAWPVSGRLLDTLPIGFSEYSRYGAPWVEEALKGGAVAWLFARNRVGFKLDALVSGFAIGAGFSVIENVFYLWHFAQLPLGVWVIRGLGTAVMHGATAATFAVVAQHVGEREAKAPIAHWRPHPWRYLPGYVAAAALHTLFNHFPDDPQLAMLTTLLAAPLLAVLVFGAGTREADAWLAEEEQDHRAALAALGAGRFPQTPAGDRLDALAQRLGSGTAAPAVGELYAALSAIALRAEATLAAHSAAPVDAHDLTLVARRRTAATKLGRVGVALATPLLPFTRHEWWEIARFEARVVHARGAHG